VDDDAWHHRLVRKDERLGLAVRDDVHIVL
jgi:hypothetical protein